MFSDWPLGLRSFPSSPHPYPPPQASVAISGRGKKDGKEVAPSITFINTAALLPGPGACILAAGSPEQAWLGVCRMHVLLADGLSPDSQSPQSAWKRSPPPPPVLVMKSLEQDFPQLWAGWGGHWPRSGSLDGGVGTSLSRCGRPCPTISPASHSAQPPGESCDSPPAPEGLCTLTFRDGLAILFVKGLPQTSRPGHTMIIHPHQEHCSTSWSVFLSSCHGRHK